MFFRKSLLTFCEMSFEQVARLSVNLQAYLTKPTAMVTEGPDHQGQPPQGQPPQGQPQLIGLSQIEQLIDQQVESMEGSRCLLPPAEYQAVLDYLESLAPAALKIHYLSYLNCLRMGEFIGAVEHLHKYFDYFLGGAAAG